MIIKTVSLITRYLAVVGLACLGYTTAINPTWGLTFIASVTATHTILHYGHKAWTAHTARREARYEARMEEMSYLTPSPDDSECTPYACGCSCRN